MTSRSWYCSWSTRSPAVSLGEVYTPKPRGAARPVGGADQWPFASCGVTVAPAEWRTAVPGVVKCSLGPRLWSAGLWTPTPR